jgi:hypothetical protein
MVMRILVWALSIMLATGASSGAAQVLTAGKCIASGFTPVPSSHPELTQQLEAVGTYAYESRRPQEDYPNWIAHSAGRDARLSCGWSMNMAAEQLVQMLLIAPQDPGTDLVTMRTEPVGKQSFGGGVLLLTRSTHIDVGLGTRPDLVTYSAQWHGAVSGGLLTIGVDNVLGSKEPIEGWIAEVIDRTVVRSP